MTTVDLLSGQHSWDNSEPASHSSTSTKRSKAPVPDNWDDDEDEEVEQTPQDVWDAANRVAPMPEILRSATSSTSTAAPPPITAFEPSLRILKRASPAVAAHSSSSSSSPQPSESLADKEARYKAAREKIFGPDTAQNGSSPGASHSKQSRPTLKILDSDHLTSSTVSRQPLGPGTAENNAPSRGFGKRKQGKGRPDAS